MMDDSAFRKTHQLNVSTRLLLIVPSLALVVILFAPLILQWDASITIWDILLLLLLLLCLPGFGILYATFCRLVTAPTGIENYSSFPFHSFISWNKVDRVEQGPLGVVNLICSPKEGKTVNQIITISTFIDDWQHSELVQEIKKYASHIIIPEELLNKKTTPFFHRSGTLLIYFTLSMLLLFIPIAFLPSAFSEQYKNQLHNANFGFIWASLGGMQGLLWFGDWRDKEVDKKKINKVLGIFYLTPFTAYFMLLVLGIVLYVLPISKNLVKLLLNSSAFFLGIFQLQLLLRVFGKAIGLKKITQGEK